MNKFKPRKKDINNPLGPRPEDSRSDSCKVSIERFVTHLRQKENLNTPEKMNSLKKIETQISNFEESKKEIISNSKRDYDKSFNAKEAENNSNNPYNSNYFYNDSDKNLNAENITILAEANKENDLNFINHPNIIYKSKKNEKPGNSASEVQSPHNFNKSKFAKGSSFRKSTADIIGDFISRNNKIENNFKFQKTDNNIKFDPVNGLNYFENSKHKNYNQEFEDYQNNFSPNQEYEIINIDKTTTDNEKENCNKNKIKDHNIIYPKTPNESEADKINYEILDWNNQAAAKSTKINTNSLFNPEKKFEKKNEKFIYKKSSNKNSSCSNECFENAFFPDDLYFGTMNKLSDDLKFTDNFCFSLSFNLENSSSVRKFYFNSANKNFNLNTDNNNNINKNTKIINKNSDEYLNYITERNIEDNKNSINNLNKDISEVKYECKSKVNNMEEDGLPSENKKLKIENSYINPVRIVREPSVMNTEYEKINTENAFISDNYGTLDKIEPASVLVNNSNKLSTNAIQERNIRNKIYGKINLENNKTKPEAFSNFRALLGESPKNKQFSESKGNLIVKRHVSLTGEKTNIEFISNTLKQTRKGMANSSFKNQNQKQNSFPKNNNIFESQNTIFGIKDSKEFGQQETNDEKSFQCRICLENNIIQTSTEVEDRFISPCVCHGTMKYVHESCLKKWIPNQVKKTSKAECEICKSAYKIKFETKLVYSADKMCHFLERFFTFVGIVCLLLFIISFVIFSIVVNIIKFTSEEKDTFTLILSLSGVSIILIVVVIILKNYKKNVYEVIPTGWTVLEFDTKDQNYEKNISYDWFRKLNAELDASGRENTQIINGNNSLNNHVIVVNNANAENQNINLDVDNNQNNYNINNIRDNNLMENNININDLEELRQEIDFDLRNNNILTNANNLDKAMINNTNNNIQIVHHPNEQNLILGTNNAQKDVIIEDKVSNLNGSGGAAYKNKSINANHNKSSLNNENNKDIYYQETEFNENHRNSNNLEIADSHANVNNSRAQHMGN